MLNAIVLYTTPSCSYCVRAKTLLNRRNLTWSEVDVSADEQREWLVGETGRTTVPQIRIGSRWVGGYTDLAELDQSGELARLVATPSSSGDQSAASTK